MRLKELLCPKITVISARNAKAGSISPAMMIMLVVLVLGGLFFAVEIPIRLVQQNTMADTLTNASSSAVTRIDEELVKEGSTKVNESLAKDAAYEIIADSYGMKLDSSKRKFALTEGSPFKEPPLVIVKVVDKPQGAGKDWKSVVQVQDGLAGVIYDEVEVKESTVIVYMKAKFKSLVIKTNKGMTLERTSASQVKIRSK